MKKTNKNNLENMVVKGRVTATSDKFDEKYRSAINTKTAYLKLDEVESKKLEDFGLQKYTSKEDGESFFIVKLTRELKIYSKSTGLIIDVMPGEVKESLNFETDVIHMNIIKGENMGQVFYRLQALLVEDIESDVTAIQPQNPFEGLVSQVENDDIPF